MKPEQVQTRLTARFDYLRRTLISKNKAYGNSVYEPVQYASSMGASALIRVRVDDKLARLRTAGGTDSEDALLDLVGYLALYHGLGLGEGATPIDRINYGVSFLQSMTSELCDVHKLPYVLDSVADWVEVDDIASSALRMKLLTLVACYHFALY